MSLTTEVSVSPTPTKAPEFSLLALKQAFTLAASVLADAGCAAETRVAAAKLESVLLEIDSNAQAYSASIHQARQEYCNDELEIDDNAIVSVGDEGCWVSAWVYVSFPDETEH